MNFNFFDWIRDGVKRSVLLGVSEAAEQMGMPPEEEAARTKILSFLQQEEIPAGLESTPRRRIANSGGAATGSSRKLGRSIADIHPGK